MIVELNSLCSIWDISEMENIMGDCIIKLDIWCILFLQGSNSKIEILKKRDFIAPQSLLDI